MKKTYEYGEVCYYNAEEQLHGENGSVCIIYIIGV